MGGQKKANASAKSGSDNGKQGKSKVTKAAKVIKPVLKKTPTKEAVEKKVVLKTEKSKEAKEASKKGSEKKKDPVVSTPRGSSTKQPSETKNLLMKTHVSSNSKAAKSRSKPSPVKASSSSKQSVKKVESKKCPPATVAKKAGAATSIKTKPTTNSKSSGGKPSGAITSASKKSDSTINAKNKGNKTQANRNDKKSAITSTNSKRSNNNSMKNNAPTSVKVKDSNSKIVNKPTGEKKMTPKESKDSNNKKIAPKDDKANVTKDKKVVIKESEKPKLEESAKTATKSKKKDPASYEHAYEDPDWEGNEDETGSVESGVMEEDFCFECGISTLADCDTWDNVILCDRCDAEYHLKCLGLDIVPRKAYICRKCIREEENMGQLKFDVGESFKIPKRKYIERKVVYSPSRPLESAWQECVNKGLMVVSDVFPYDVMKVLTHGTMEHRTKSGRLVDIWQGAVKEVPQRLSSNAFHNVVDRQGRYDLKLPDFLIQQLKLNELLEPILTKLRTIMGTPAPQIRTHDIVFVPVGSSAQEWHADDSMRKHKVHRYFTILIHLNPLDVDCGGTEVWSHQTKKSDMIRGRPGDALVFNGSLLHRGQANNGFTHRFFYYASFACGSDMNVGMM